jgi:hypothetical protein
MQARCVVRTSIALIFLLGFVIASAGPAAAGAADAGAADADALTTRAAETLAKALPAAKVTVKGPLQLGLTMQSRSFTVRLDNPFDYCGRDPPNCDRALQAYLANLAATLKEAAEPLEKSAIRVVVRSTGYVEDAHRQAAGKPGALIIARPLAGDLWVLPVVDRPHGVKPLSAADLAGLGLSEDAAIALGKRNLASAIPPVSSVMHDLGPNAVGTISGNFYDSSRVVLHDQWAPLAKKLGGRLIVAVPATDVLVYGEAKDPAALDALATFAREAAKRSQRPISTTVLKWVPGGWEVVRP